MLIVCKPAFRRLNWGTVIASFIIFCSLWAGARPLYAADQVIHLLAYEDPPFAVSKTDTAPISGRTVDVLTKLFDAAGVEKRFSVVSIKRALSTPLTDPNSCGFSFVKMPGRLNHYQWLGPIQKGAWGVFTRPAIIYANGEKPTLEELKQEKLLVQGGSAIAIQLREEGFNVQELGSAQMGIRTLFAGRADYIVGGVTTLPTKAKLQGFDDLAMVALWKKQDFYLLCSPDMDKKILDGLKDALTSLKNSNKIVLN